MVRVSFLESSEVLRYLRENVPRAIAFQLAVAFVTKEGFGTIRDSLLSLVKDRRRSAQLVIGTSGSAVTDWEVLKDLLRMKKSYNNLSIRYYFNRHFHPKLFALSFENRRVSVIIGSSNLTKGGTLANQEANILIEGRERNQVFRSIFSYFDETFSAAPRLDSAFVDRYRRIATKVRLRRQNECIDMPETPLHVGFDRDYPCPDTAFWKVAPGEHGTEWEDWESGIDGRKRGFVAVYFQHEGKPLRMKALSRRKPLKEAIEEQLECHPIKAGYLAKQTKYFLDCMKEGDVVVAYSSATIFGIARIETDAVDFVGGADPQNRRRVKWLNLQARQLTSREWKDLAFRDTVRPILDTNTIRLVQRIISNRM